MSLRRRIVALVTGRDTPTAGPSGHGSGHISGNTAGLQQGGGAEQWPEVSFEDRMATVEFRVAPDAHITVDGDTCRGCTTKQCVHACPANLFAPTADGGIVFNYEQCFECGTCYMICNNEGAITWTYPEGGSGVVFRDS